MNLLSEKFSEEIGGFVFQNEPNGEGFQGVRMLVGLHFGAKLPYARGAYGTLRPANFLGCFKCFRGLYY